MAEKEGILLSSIKGFPEAVSRRLADLWITTAEEFVAAATQKQGPQGLASYLGVTEAEIIRLIDLAEAVLPPSFSFAPGRIEQHGLGALDEPQEQGPEDEQLAFAAPLPAQVDLHQRMPSIRDQGRRGTCVAHACVAVREFLLGEASTQIDLSEQFLYWSCKQRDGLVGFPGTYLSTGIGCLKEEGVCREEVWLYNPEPLEGNEGQGPPPENAQMDAAKYCIIGSTSLPARSVSVLKQVLAGRQPVVFVVPVFNYWWTVPTSFTGDIRLPLPYVDESVGGHAMCLVGYEDDPQVPGGGYFLARNSWGTDWASGNTIPGYCRIPYKYLEQNARVAYTFWLSPIRQTESP